MYPMLGNAFAHPDSIWRNPNVRSDSITPLRSSFYDSLHDSRGRPLTTWSFIDDLVERERESQIAPLTPYGLSLGADRTSAITPIFSSPMHQQLSVPSPTRKEQSGSLRWRLFNYSSKKKNRRNKQQKLAAPPAQLFPPPFINEAFRSNQIATIQDRPFENNQFRFSRPNTGTSQVFLPRPVRRESSSSEFALPHPTSPAKFAAAMNQQTVAMPANVTATPRRDHVPLTPVSEYVKPNENEAMVLGNAPVIPTRDGRYAEAGKPRTVYGHPITSMTGTLDYDEFPPLPTIQASLPPRPAFKPVNNRSQPTMSNSSKALKHKDESTAEATQAFFPPNSSALPRIPETTYSSNGGRNQTYITGNVPFSHEPATYQEAHPYNFEPNNGPNTTGGGGGGSSGVGPPTYLSATAPTFQPSGNGNDNRNGNDNNFYTMPTTSSYAPPSQITLEQLVTRIDRLQLKAEEDRQLLYAFANRQTRDRAEIRELRQIIRAMEERERRYRKDYGPVGGEIGDAWYGK